jgi:formate dehydrogenase subunit delta
VSPVEKLVMMANDIARNLAVQGADKAVTGTADHIARFWDPRMRATIIAHMAAGGAGLSPAARDAVLLLKAPLPSA